MVFTVCFYVCTHSFKTCNCQNLSFIPTPLYAHTLPKAPVTAGIAEPPRLVHPGTTSTPVLSTVFTKTGIPVSSESVTNSAFFTKTAVQMTSKFVTKLPPPTSTNSSINFKTSKPQIFTAVAQIMNQLTNRSQHTQDVTLKAGKLIDLHVGDCGCSGWMIACICLGISSFLLAGYISTFVRPSFRFIRVPRILRKQKCPVPEVRASDINLIGLETVKAPASIVKIQTPILDAQSTPIHQKHIVSRSDLPPTPLLDSTPVPPKLPFIETISLCTNGSGFGLENPSTLSEGYVEFLGRYPNLLNALTTLLFELYHVATRVQTNNLAKATIYSQVMADACSRLQAMYILDRQESIVFPFGPLASEHDIVVFLRRATRNGELDSGLIVRRKIIKLANLTIVPITHSEIIQEDEVSC